MKPLCLLAALLALPAWPDVPSIEVKLTVQLVKPDAICAKALAVLTAAKNIENPAAMLLVNGKPNTGKCLEAIFSEASSPTNGYTIVSAERDQL